VGIDGNCDRRGDLLLSLRDLGAVDAFAAHVMMRG
jgi:hypothetical protein